MVLEALSLILDSLLVGFSLSKLGFEAIYFLSDDPDLLDDDLELLCLGISGSLGLVGSVL